jgi:hydrogenase expression/formation protein HypC
MCLGVPGQVVSIDATNPDFPFGRVSFAGVIKEVCLAYTPEARVGDYVVVHVGFAISRLDEAEARQTLEYLQEIERLAAEPEPPGEP